jgi:hypothetical protein
MPPGATLQCIHHPVSLAEPGFLCRSPGLLLLACHAWSRRHPARNGEADAGVARRAAGECRGEHAGVPSRGSRGSRN